MKHLFTLFMLPLVALTSCIQSEPDNAECDILTATLPADMLNRAPVVENDKVIFYLNRGVSRAELAPEFTLTPGATIDPPSGTVLDFTHPQYYTVTSQDGQWSKRYIVEAPAGNVVNLTYDFEHVKTYSGYNYSYDIFYEENASGGEAFTWASANAAFALTGQGKEPNTFPTYQVEAGFSGSAVALTTRSTGTFGALAKKPLASGSLFMGKFNTATAMSKPLESTQFGMPFYSVPQTLEGMYSYVPGEKYQELGSDGKLVDVPGKTDECNIYAVFFDTSDGVEYLDGTNVLAADNPAIVATAELQPDKRGATGGWSDFSIPFVYRKNADGSIKKIDEEKLANGQYSIAVVFASSLDGDYFSGAVGSTLTVDEVRLVCEE